jgi:predicted nucleotidyltransferase
MQEEMLQKIKKVLKEEKNIVFGYLFGSILRSPKYSKDIDIAIFTKGKVGTRYESKIALKIEKEIKVPVEILILNDKPTLIISEVLRNCKVIFSRNERARIKFEMFALRDILEFNELMKEFEQRRFERYGIR